MVLALSNMGFGGFHSTCGADMTNRNFVMLSVLRSTLKCGCFKTGLVVLLRWSTVYSMKQNLALSICFVEYTSCIGIFFIQKKSFD